MRHVLGAAVIEAEDLVVEVQAGEDKAQSSPNSTTGLKIHLEVRIEVVVAIWAFRPAGSIQRWIRCVVDVLIGIVICAVIGQAEVYGDAAVLVIGFDIESMACLADEGRVVGPVRNSMSVRTRIRVVRVNSEAAEKARQRGKPLLPTEFQSIYAGIGSIDV